MRYYAIHRAQSIGAAAAAPSLLGRLFRNWRTRRRLARLIDLDDPILDDIGFTRAELSRALSLPLTVNASEELEQSAFRRRLGEARRHPRARPVGLTEEELGWALSVPLTLNPTVASAQRAFRSRVGEAFERPRRANEIEPTRQAALRKMALTVLVVAGSLAVAAIAPERKPADVLGLQLRVADGAAARQN